MKKFKIFGHVQVEKSSVLSIETHDVIWYIKNKLMQDSLGEACTEKLQSYASMDFTGLHKTKQISSSSFKSSKQSKTRKHCFYYLIFFAILKELLSKGSQVMNILMVV